MHTDFDVIIVGGGAAGFFTAINLAEKNRSLRIAIVERGKDVLQKVRISGGGRCNVTHACFDADIAKDHVQQLGEFPPRGGVFIADDRFKTAFPQWTKGLNLPDNLRSNIAIRYKIIGKFNRLFQANIIGFGVGFGFITPQVIGHAEALLSQTCDDGRGGEG